ncbi:MFS general substrate transporter [Artomyces pyxidatus]|uniref:MFS general substrate transporter n=1 Tax=Artomyces pyxidatus TaxID=48021 RepID=A0ACB8SWN0_9AGAM|nr:MFS general substrate transporter [Artomyces pyxidatus]
MSVHSGPTFEGPGDVHKYAPKSEDNAVEPDVEGLASDRSAPATFPEGGARAWLTVIGGSLVVFCTFGTVQSFGVYQDYYTRVSLHEHSASQVSWIGSFQLFLLFSLGLPTGRLYDEGYFRSLIAGGSFIYLFSLFMLSLTKSHHYYQVFLSQGLGMGIGMGSLLLPSLSVTSHYFHARRSLSMGFVMTGASIGGVIWPIMLNRLLSSSAGFAWAVRASGFVALVSLVMAFFLMRTRLPGRKDNPDATIPKLEHLLTDAPYWMCIAGTIQRSPVQRVPVFYLQLFATLHGVPRSLAHYTLPIMNGASFFGRTLPMLVADRYGRFNGECISSTYVHFFLPMTTIAGFLMFAMFGATNTAGLISFAVLYGLFSGAFLALIGPVLTIFAKDVSEVGYRMGLGMFVFSFAMLTGNPLAGSLLRSPLYEWDRPIVFSAVMVLAGCVFLAISRAMLVKQRGTVWV